MPDSDYERAIRNELDYWPGARVEFSKRAKHAEARLYFGSVSRFVTIPDTPSDRRGALNSIADVRRELTTLGATRLTRKPSKRKRAGKVIGTKRPVREPLQHIERAPVKPDPFAVLAKLVPTPEPRLAWWRHALDVVGGWIAGAPK